MMRTLLKVIRTPTAGDWRVACDSYGNVRHSRRACVYVNGPRGILTLAARIPNWDDALLMSAARDLRDTLRGLLPVLANDCTQHLVATHADVIARAEAAIAKAEGREPVKTVQARAAELRLGGPYTAG
jgi:hypothetical protein